MGYRSNIRCVVYHNGEHSEEEYEKLKLLLNTTFKDVVANFESDLRFVDSKLVVDFEINDVKWYDSFPDVIGFMAMLPVLEEAGYQYEYIRVGEDHDDVEFRHTDGGNGYLSTHTEITCYY